LHITSGQDGTLEIADPTAGWQCAKRQHRTVRQLHCSSFVTAVGGADGSPSSPISDSQPPLLTHPQA
jgi:hypothetical protein